MADQLSHGWNEEVCVDTPAKISHVQAEAKEADTNNEPGGLEVFEVVLLWCKEDKTVFPRILEKRTIAIDGTTTFVSSMIVSVPRLDGGKDKQPMKSPFICVFAGHVAFHVWLIATLLSIALYWSGSLWVPVWHICGWISDGMKLSHHDTISWAGHRAVRPW